MQYVSKNQGQKNQGQKPLRAKQLHKQYIFINISTEPTHLWFIFIFVLVI